MASVEATAKAGWEVKSLGEVCGFQGGSQPPKSTFINDAREGYVRLLQIRDFKSDKYITFIPESPKNRVCTKEDILIGRYGASVGQIHTGKAGAYNVALMKTMPDLNLLNRKFFFLYLNSHLFQSLLMNAADRAAQNGFSKEDISPFPVPLPPLAEQERIVGILNEAFEGIAAATAQAEKNLHNARELFQSVLQSTFSQKGDDWVETTLGEVCSKIGSGATPRGGKNAYKTEGISLIRSLNVYDREFRDAKLAFIDQDQADKLSNVVVEEGDVLLNITGASVARCCVAPAEHLPARVNQHVSIIRTLPGTSIPSFLNQLLTSKEYKDQLLGIGNKGGATRQAITKSEIQGFKVLLPPLSTQEAIVKKLDALSEETKRLEVIYERKKAALAELKQSLLQKAFAGEL